MTPRDAHLPLEGVRVLVLEDEYFIASDLARALDAAGAATVGPIGQLDQAARAIEAGHFDAAIVDLNIRGSLSDQLAERIAGRDIPCLLVTGYSKDAIPCTAAGPPRIEKPAETDAVLGALVRLIADRQS